MSMNENFTPEINPLQLTKGEILTQFRDRHVPKPLPEGELSEAVKNTYPHFIQRHVASRMMELPHIIPEIKDASPAHLQHYSQILADDLLTERYTFDPETKLRNKAFRKEYLMEMIGDQLSRGHDQFNHVAEISIDLNGLKAVNDITGQHSVGDEYIRRVSAWLWESEVLHDLKQQDYTVLLARTGGDEFSITVVGKPDTEKDWDAIWHEVRVGLQVELESIDVADLIPRELIKPYFAGQDSPQLPDDFRFTAGAGIGMTTLEDALTRQPLNNKNYILKEDSPERLQEKLMGALLDGSDRMMKLHKEHYKQERGEGNDHERALEYLIARTEEQRRAEDRADAAENELMQIKRELEEVRNRLSEN